MNVEAAPAPVPEPAPDEPGGSAFVPVVACLSVAALAVFALQPPDGAPDVPEPSALVARPPACLDADAPLARGREALDQARAHMARYPFAPEEGPRAVVLALEAQRCLAELDAAQADRAAREAERWTHRLARDYAAARARLTRALATEDATAAREEIATLTRLLAGHDDPYTAWLVSVDHRLVAAEEPQP